MKTVTTIFYTDAADKWAASWLDCVAKHRLEGYNSHNAALQESYAMQFIHQVLRDNPVSTNYAATMEEIKRELESDNEGQS